MTIAGGRRPVLLVDDDPDQRAFVADAVRAAGFLVVEAENGKVALDYLLGTKPEPGLIVLDLSIPVMSGREILSILRRYLRLSRIPVVIVSAEPPTRTPTHASIVGFLTKPYRFENLQAIVEKHARAI
jgi:DNA-binding response OmpR family regulator